jgi:hypothetical protein
MLSSEDKSLREAAIPLLLNYLRSQQSPMLTHLADYIDRNASTNWKLELKRRHRGSRPSDDRATIGQIELFRRVEELTAEYKAQGLRSPRKRAKRQIIEETGVSEKKIEAAITSFRKILAK